MEIRAISSTAVLKASLLVFGVLVALRFLWIAHAIFIIGLLGVLLGLALSKAVDFLERFRIRRGLGAPLTLVVGIGLLVAVGTFVAPAIRDQTGQIADELPKALQQVEAQLGANRASALTTELAKELRSATKFLFPIISSFFGAVAGLIIVLFIAMYIAAEPELYREGLVHLVPHRDRERAREVFVTLATTLRQWLIARLLAMVVIGLVTGLGLALLRVKGAAALGVLAGLLEIIPFFGPFASAIPAVGIALVESPQKALLVVGLYVIVQQLEGNVITPLLLEKRLAIPPVLTVVAVAAMGVVFGVIGMLVAEPLLAAGLVVTKMLYVQDVVGDEVKVGKSE